MTKAVSSKQSTSNVVVEKISKASEEWFKKAAEVGCEQLQANIDTNLMLLICVGGMVPALLDHDIWKKFMADMNPHVRATSSTTIKQKVIPNEAAVVRNEQFLELQQEFNLTLTFDGGGTCGKQSIYFVHITTPTCEVYFVCGDEASDISHTAKYITDVLKLVGYYIPMSILIFMQVI